jgi:peptide methionine sulfoxide reductase MsrA
MRDPNYGNLGDHTEALEIDFDPRRITYTELLQFFWNSHDPTARSGGRQYLNALFFQNDAQRQLAISSMAAIEKEIGSSVHTEILPVESFTRAEDYHQKYLLFSHPVLAGELAAVYPNKKKYVDATSVARLNGYAGGYGNKVQLKREIEILGLSSEGKRYLLKIME